MVTRKVRQGDTCRVQRLAYCCSISRFICTSLARRCRSDVSFFTSTSSSEEACSQSNALLLGSISTAGQTTTIPSATLHHLYPILPLTELHTLKSISHCEHCRATGKTTEAQRWCVQAFCAMLYLPSGCWSRLTGESFAEH